MGKVLQIVLLVYIFALVQALQHYNNFREGSCSGVRMQPIRRLNRRWIDSVTPFIPAASKYHYYRIASNHPRYFEMQESEFYQEFCYKRNLSSTQKTAHSIAFGGIVASYDVRVPYDKSDVYVELNPRRPEHRGDILRQFVTLTDNKSFIFISMCWTGVNQRAWMVYSTRPYLDPPTQKIIAGHAAQLGFKSENVIFIGYDRCASRNPFIGTGSQQQSDASAFHHYLPVTAASSTDDDEWILPPSRGRGHNRRGSAATWNSYG